MKGGVIITRKAVGDVYFVSRSGRAMLPPSKNVEVIINEMFSGQTLRDAVESAMQFASGAIKERVAQKMRGFNCVAQVRNIRVGYMIKHGFSKPDAFERILQYSEGDQIIKKGDRGSEFFWIKEGVVDINGLQYKAGNVFGRAAFSDGVRKMDVFAKTDVTIVAIDKNHPSLSDKLTVVLKKFAEETEKIRRVRPRASIDTVVIKCKV
ncbi:MAG: cyclic nucleotide-binding domain-containing protein [Spirochaetales bacterium]|nr:cyclic nucleotide-binding domain-containing protein [Spirochaetales bacterium]